MAEPTGTVENSSVLIINHPPSSVMRDWSFYTHRTTQCHSKYGWKITPNSLPSKWTQSRCELQFFIFFLAAHRCKKEKKVQAWMDGCMNKWPHKCMLHTHVHTVILVTTSPSSDEHAYNCKITQVRTNKCIKKRKKPPTPSIVIFSLGRDAGWVRHRKCVWS